MKPMRIGLLAQQTDTHIETIRYYEKQGLLPEPQRDTANFRVYQAQHVERLNFIRQCRLLDLSLEEIRQLLEVKDTPAASCDAVNQVVDEHIHHVQQRIQELQGLAEKLQHIRGQCQTAQAAARCGILQELSQPVSAQDKAELSRETHLK